MDRERLREADRALRRYCRGGDEEAFRRFYRTHADPLWRYLVARGADPEGAYDLVAEAFTRLIQSVCRDPRAPAALLYRIATNLHIDSGRRHAERRVVRDEARVIAAVDPAPEPVEERETVRTLLEGLDAREQNVLLMRYWIGLTHRETAEALDLPEGTVRRVAAAALAQLRERLEDK